MAKSAFGKKEKGERKEEPEPETNQPQHNT